MLLNFAGILRVLYDYGSVARPGETKATPPDKTGLSSSCLFRSAGREGPREESATCGGRVSRLSYLIPSEHH